jgi:hypothetical protein
MVSWTTIALTERILEGHRGILEGLRWSQRIHSFAGPRVLMPAEMGVEMAAELISAGRIVFNVRIRTVLRQDGSKGGERKFLGKTRKTCNDRKGEGQSGAGPSSLNTDVFAPDCPSPQFLTEVGLAAEPHTKPERA